MPVAQPSRKQAVNTMQPCLHELAQNITLLVLLQPQHTSLKRCKRKRRMRRAQVLDLGQNKSIQQTAAEGLLCIYVAITQEESLLTDSQQFQRVNSSIRISVITTPCICPLDCTHPPQLCVISTHAICSCSLPFPVWDSAPRDSRHQVP